jgi:hypothetical protein
VPREAPRSLVSSVGFLLGKALPIPCHAMSVPWSSAARRSVEFLVPPFYPVDAFRGRLLIDF